MSPRTLSGNKLSFVKILLEGASQQVNAKYLPCVEVQAPVIITTNFPPTDFINKLSQSDSSSSSDSADSFLSRLIPIEFDKTFRFDHEELKLHPQAIVDFIMNHSVDSNTTRHNIQYDFVIRVPK